MNYKCLFTISHRSAKFLACQGLLIQDVENSYLNLEEEEDGAMQQLLGH